MPTKQHKGESRRVATFLSAVAAMLLTSGMPAAAEGSVTVKADQAKIVAVRGEPSTVVIGNPLYAEATVREGMVVIHGRHFGTTNVLVLDDEGNTLSDFEVYVTRGGAKNVTMYKAGATFSYQCSPGCESSLQVGDNGDYFEMINKEVGAKLGLSTGASKSSE